MVFTISDWHQRYTRQAAWTVSLRNHIYQLIHLTSDQSILDVGCGSGTLLPELNHLSGGHVFGIDLSLENLLYANGSDVRVPLTQGDGLELPFSESTFDVTLCHFLLLWVHSPIRCLQEMRRVTRKRGWVLALAEPDYGGRVDYPSSLEIIGSWQRQALTAHGAEVDLGRQLLTLFVEAGLENVLCGVIGGRWSPKFDQQEWQNEWDTIMQDLFSLSTPPDQETVEEIRLVDLNTSRAGKRVLYVPTFYALGQVPD